MKNYPRMMNNKLTQQLTADITQWVRENGLVECGGATLISLCRHFGISDRTFHRWCKRNDFAEAIAEAKKFFADHLERDLVQSLAKAAKGYNYVKRKTEYTSDKNGNPVVKKQTTEDVDVQPNVGAAIFLLTNIAPERWVNKQTNVTDLQGSLTLGVKVVNGTPDISTSESEVDAERK